MSIRKFLAAGVLLSFAGALFAKPAPGPNVVKEPTKEPAKASPLDYKVQDIDGKDVDLKQYKGKVVMIINVASKCGNTPQYKGLEELYKKYSDKGFVILGFPANDFGKQEPGSNADIKEFCTSKYNVSFPMMSKVSTKDPEKAPIYKFLTEKQTAGDFAGEIDWNFAKFLVDRNGSVIARWRAGTKPDDASLVGEVEKALEAKAVAEKK